MSLRMRLVGAVLAAAVASPNAVAAFQPLAFLSATPAGWMRDYTPAQFRQLAVSTDRIDPVNFCESLLVAAIFQETNQQRADFHFPAFLPDGKSVQRGPAARQMDGWHLCSFAR